MYLYRAHTDPQPRQCRIGGKPPPSKGLMAGRTTAYVRTRYEVPRACFRVVFGHNGPLISKPHQDCQTGFQCNGSVSTGPCIPGTPPLNNHHVPRTYTCFRVVFPSLTARSQWEPTTASRFGWPVHFGPPRKSAVYGTITCACFWWFSVTTVLSYHAEPTTIVQRLIRVRVPFVTVFMVKKRY